MIWKTQLDEPTQIFLERYSFLILGYHKQTYHFKLPFEQCVSVFVLCMMLRLRLLVTFLRCTIHVRYYWEVVVLVRKAVLVTTHTLALLFCYTHIQTGVRTCKRTTQKDDFFRSLSFECISFSNCGVPSGVPPDMAACPYACRLWSGSRLPLIYEAKA